MSTDTLKPDWRDGWDSMEGVPEWPERTSIKPASASDSLVQRAGQQALLWLGTRAAGFVLAAMLAMAAEWLAQWIGTRLLGYPKSPINGIPLAIVMGMILCNVVGVPSVFQDGLRACIRQLLRLAIVLLGLRLSLSALGGIGLGALPVVLLCVTAALVFVPWVGKYFGVPRRLATLIAVGTGICGVSAIVATAPTIDAEEDEISYAVACVTIFGMVAMLLYPFLAPWLFGADLRSTGIFLGTAIHDTSQVAGAALAYQQTHQAPEVLNTAAVVKLMRNLSMAVVIPLMALLYHRGERGAKSAAQPWHHIFPLFVIGFFAMTLLRTLGDATAKPFGFLEHTLWTQFLAFMDRTATTCLTVVMAAVGLSTGLARLKKLGLRPFMVGFSAALTVGAVSIGALKLSHLLGF